MCSRGDISELLRSLRGTVIGDSVFIPALYIHILSSSIKYCQELLYLLSKVGHKSHTVSISKKIIIYLGRRYGQSLNSQRHVSNFRAPNDIINRSATLV